MSKALQGVLAKLPVLKIRSGFGGFAVLTLCMLAAFSALPPVALRPGSGQFIFAFGAFSAWRYSWGAVNYIRSIIYRRYVFPRWRCLAEEGGDSLLPSKVYLLLTSYRIDAATTAKVVSAAIEEAIACGLPTTIVASIVELGDELLYKNLFHSYNPPARVELVFIRARGTGKRDALAGAFRAISRDVPPSDALVAVIDGDTVLTHGCLRKCAPFFKLNPKLGALTTDEIAEGGSTALIREWYDMRFAQRHILMGSIALSKRVMTLTGRMSVFRASIITDPDFIDTMAHDYLDHWRLGRFRFLTGDDKSSLYWVLKQGWEQIYVPDVVVVTMEDPLAKNFLSASTKLMLRWFGNMLRTNMRILALGPRRMPFFVWWAFLDQRFSMWTSLTGPVFAAFGAVFYGPVFLAYYALWVLFVRWVLSLSLLSARPVLSWRYPFLLYYNQVYGALVKTYILFRLDRQSWTRQKTKLDRSLSSHAIYWNNVSSLAVHMAALMVFISAMGVICGVFEFPY